MIDSSAAHEKYLSVKDVAQRLGVGEMLIWRECRRKALESVRVGHNRGRVLITERALTDYLKSRSSNGAIAA